MVHKETRSHAGDFVTIVIGISYAQSSKQKLHTNISIYVNLVRVYDVLTQLIWNRYFLKNQENKICDNVIYKDNQSAIKLEKNGRGSSRKQTRHINIRYCFITDRITKEKTSVEFCTTLDTIRDNFTKALQGSQFCCFRNIIIGISQYYIPSYNESKRALI